MDGWCIFLKRTLLCGCEAVLWSRFHLPVSWVYTTYSVVNTLSLGGPGLAVTQALGPSVPCRVTWPRIALSYGREREVPSPHPPSRSNQHGHMSLVFFVCVFFFPLSFFSPPKLLYFDIWNVIFKWAYLKGCRFNRFKPQFGLCGCVCDYIMQAFWTRVCETWAACMSALCKCVMWMFFVKRFSLIFVYLCACNWKSKSSAGLLVCSSCWWRERSDALHAVSVWRLAH